MNLLEIGKILRPHGIKGAVKVECFVDGNFNQFKDCFVTNKRVKAKVVSAQNLNKDFYIVNLDIIPDVDTAEKYRNQSIYIDREMYTEFKDKVYLADLIGKPVVNEKGEKYAEMVDYDDYGASVILTVRVGAVSYQVPYVDEIIAYDENQDAFIMSEQKFNSVRV